MIRTAKTKYFVTDKNGAVYTRTSHRVYTHVVVRHWDAYDYQKIDWANTKAAKLVDGKLIGKTEYAYITAHQPAGSAVFGWCGRYDLARAQMNQALKREGTAEVEILQVQQR